MQRRYNLAHLILAIIVALVLTLLVVCVEAQAQIAFVSHRDGNPEVYVMDIDGNNPRNLTNNPDKDWSPSWSPDGERIVFRSNRDGHFLKVIPAYEIYVMDADGGNQLNLTNNPSDDSFPSWSPDGKRIAFASYRDKKVKNFIPTYEIYVMNADGGNPQNLTNDRNEDWYPSWSPDGKRIAFMSLRDGHIIDVAPTYEIYVMDADGGNPQNLTNDLNDDRYPSWSPDSKRIVFTAERPGHFRSKFGITDEIYVMDADGKNQQRLTENRKNDWFPSWSPDGERIAFAADRKGDSENLDIYVMDADGGNQQNLTNNRRDDWSPSWSSDSRRIAFSSWRDGNSEIYVMDADGGNPRRLTNNRHGDFSLTWFGPAFAVKVAPFAVAPASKTLVTWGWLKQVDR